MNSIRTTQYMYMYPYVYIYIYYIYIYQHIVVHVCKLTPMIVLHNRVSDVAMQSMFCFLLLVWIPSEIQLTSHDQNLTLTKIENGFIHGPAPFEFLVMGSNTTCHHMSSTSMLDPKRSDPHLFIQLWTLLSAALAKTDIKRFRCNADSLLPLFARIEFPWSKCKN